VHLGHKKEPVPDDAEVEFLGPPPDATPSPLTFGGGPGACLFVIAAIAAFTTWVKGGFIPQARHGGNGVRAFAVAGSKFEGTGLENEHIGQTQVALGGGAGAGEPWRSGVVEGGLCVDTVETGVPRDSCFDGLG
jgi:hypothetical protein